MKKPTDATIWRGTDKILNLTLYEPIYPEGAIVIGKPKLPEPMTSHRWNEWIKTEIGMSWAKEQLMEFI